MIFLRFNITSCCSISGLTLTIKITGFQMGLRGKCLIGDIIEPRDILFLPDLKYNVKAFQTPQASTKRPLHFVNLTMVIKFTIGN